jgi:hypothetical protein
LNSSMFSSNPEEILCRINYIKPANKNSVDTGNSKRLSIIKKPSSCISIV